MGEKSLENARKKSFEAARWEIANFAQLQKTKLLVFETQMTYEEMGKDSSFSVWRLVKVPSQMLKNARTVMKKNKPFYQELVTHISSLEKESKNELADDLRRAVASGVEESELKQFFLDPHIPPVKKKYTKSGTEDKILPTGSIFGISPYCLPDEKINLSIHAQDNDSLKSVMFSIDDSHIAKKWNTDRKIFRRNYSFSTKGLHLGEHRYSFKVVDTSDNSFINRGSFHINDLHNELRRLFLEEFKE